MRYFTIICLFIGSALTSCSYKQSQVLLQQKNNSIDTTVAKSKVNIGNYRIRPHDILQIINVQANKDLVDLTAGVAQSSVISPASQAQPSNYVVEDDGTVALTGLGRIKVAGLTRIEARNYLEDLYSKKILTNPLLEIKIVNLKVSMLGEVKTPGEIPLTHDNTTLVEVIARAGGLTENADNAAVKIIRAGQAAKTDIIDLSNAESLSNPDIVVLNGDVVVIPKNSRTVRNEKLQDVTTIVSPLLLVINTALLVLTLIRR